MYPDYIGEIRFDAFFTNFTLKTFCISKLRLSVSMG